MHEHFPSIVPSSPETKYTPLLHPSTRGETIAQLHNRVATALEGIIADVDAEIAALEATLPAEQRTSKSILICAHAAPLIAMGRVLTGRMPEDSSEEDFYVFTAGMSTFKRRETREKDESLLRGLLAEGTKFVRARGVPAWEGGRGVGGGWDCVKNGDCTFLSDGAERGW
jgi:transcription factor C subunit 7